MHKVDLALYNIRSDLIIENNSLDFVKESYTKNDIKVDYINLPQDNVLKKEAGDYITISFQDITDRTSYNNVLEVLNLELKRILELTNIKKEDKCLIVGLGNSKSTPDALGYETLKNIIVTRHLYEINDVDRTYRNVSILEPNVLGNTGIESFDVIMGVIEKIKPDFLVFIDSLSALNINRIQKTIQITNTGISPGAGIGNNRGEFSKNNLKIPVIALGVPTVVSSSVIVADTINFLYQKISYQKRNYSKDKLVFKNNINYLHEESKLSKKEKEDLLGIVGTLNDYEINSLMEEVLNPIGYNLIVTTKEIDFIIEKLGNLIGTSLNKVLHDKDNL